MTVYVRESAGKARGEEVQFDLAKVRGALSAVRGSESARVGALASGAGRVPSPVGHLVRPDSVRPTIALAGGRFPMGTDYRGGFPEDGEGPVRPVILSPFEIDAFPVTNEDFVAFVTATGYVTDAEKSGWSFVSGHTYPRTASRNWLRTHWQRRRGGARYAAPVGSIRKDRAQAS